MKGIVARIQRVSELREAAKGKGPGARVAAMVLAQLTGERVRPL